MKSNRSSSRHSQRKKDKETKGKRKVDEELEKLLVGAGWTLAATEHFMNLNTDEEKLEHVKQMFNVSDEDYSYTERYTFIVDFHLGNGVFCETSHFSTIQTQFVCRSLGKLLDDATAQVHDPELNFDSLRLQLVSTLHDLFNEANEDGYIFKPDQTEYILRYISSTFLRPLRIIVRQFQQGPYMMQVLELRKVFQPPPPSPLEEFVEEMPLPEEDFEPIAFPKLEGLSVQDVRDSIREYTDRMIETIEKRYDKLEAMVDNLSKDVNE